MKILTAKEVAELLKITKATVYNLAAKGKLPAFRIGNSWRFEMEEIMKQLKTDRGKKERTGGKNNA